jgi:hypothetical protein
MSCEVLLDHLFVFGPNCLEKSVNVAIDRCILVKVQVQHYAPYLFSEHRELWVVPQVVPEGGVQLLNMGHPNSLID